MTARSKRAARAKSSSNGLCQTGDLTNLGMNSKMCVKKSVKLVEPPEIAVVIRPSVQPNPVGMRRLFDGIARLLALGD